MRTYGVMLVFPVIVTLPAALGSVDVADFYRGIAKAFFLVVPIGFMVGSVIGLASRFRS